MNHLNLMPIGRRKRLLRKRRLRQWSLVLACVIGCASGTTWFAWRENQLRQETADALNRQYQPVQMMQAEIDTIRKRIEMLKTQQRLAGDLSKQKSIVSLLGLLSEAAAKRADRICLQRLVLTTHRTDTEYGSQFNRDLRLEGIALSSSDVSVFSSSLEQSNAFTRVDLDSSSTRQIGSIEAQAYALRCAY